MRGARQSLQRLPRPEAGISRSGSHWPYRFCDPYGTIPPANPRIANHDTASVKATSVRVPPRSGKRESISAAYRVREGRGIVSDCG